MENGSNQGHFIKKACLKLVFRDTRKCQEPPTRRLETFDGSRVTMNCFLGVYSSRVGDLTGLHLGTVWKHSLINEIIEGGVKGKGPHDP